MSKQHFFFLFVQRYGGGGRVFNLQLYTLISQVYSLKGVEWKV